MSNIEGIPEGWELVRAGKPITGEYFLEGYAKVKQAAKGVEVTS
ncbi:MAG: hypothetical protein ACOVLE_16370 [Pirellula staleyi]